MRILLDTQCWLWMVGPTDRLTDEGLAIVGNGKNELLLSAVSAWEIAIKHTIGKLELPGEPAEVIPEWMARSAVTPLDVQHSHALHVADLPLHHADPFDRLLIAQARLEGVPVLTADTVFEQYDVEVVAG